MLRNLELGCQSSHLPLSPFARLGHGVHAYFYPDYFNFILPRMDITQTTVLGRIRQSIQIFLQKSRPYLEQNLENPIAEIAMDEVHLSTVASAMQRIHDSASKTPHSDARAHTYPRSPHSHP
jgi:hypothetical protein